MIRAPPAKVRDGNVKVKSRAKTVNNRGGRIEGIWFQWVARCIKLRGRYHTYMSPVVKAVPDVSVFLALEPEELGAKLLFLAKAGQKYDGDMFYPSNFETEKIGEADTRGQPSYPRNRQAGDRASLLGSLGLAGSSGSDRPCRRKRTG